MFRQSTGRYEEYGASGEVEKLEWYPPDEVDNIRILAEQVMNLSASTIPMFYDGHQGNMRCEECRPGPDWYSFFGWLYEQKTEDPHKKYKRRMFSCSRCACLPSWRTCGQVMGAFNKFYRDRSKFNFIISSVSEAGIDDSRDAAQYEKDTSEKRNNTNIPVSNSDKHGAEGHQVDFRKALEAINAITQIILPTTAFAQANDLTEQIAINKGLEEENARLVKEVEDLRAQNTKLRGALAELM